MDSHGQQVRAEQVEPGSVAVLVDPADDGPALPPLLRQPGAETPPEDRE